MQTIEHPIIHEGDRDQPFTALIRQFLELGRLKPQYIQVLLSPKNLQLFGKAFTAASANSTENYEIFEQLGDVSVNKFIVQYAYQRFPQLRCPTGVKVVARLRINYGSASSLAAIAEKLGFWPFISAAEDGEQRGQKYRSKHQTDLLEDVLEAIVGCTEQILDQEFRIGVGYAIVYDILKAIFDKIHISLKFEDLIDAKTRMKEVFDAFGTQLGDFKFIDNRVDGQAISRVYQVPPGQPKYPKRQNIGDEQTFHPQHSWIFIGEGTATKKAQAQQEAAEQAIHTLANAGFRKMPPIEYRLFCP
jgi:dsRNA-specific ribonuclease